MYIYICIYIYIYMYIDKQHNHSCHPDYNIANLNNLYLD